MYHAYLKLFLQVLTLILWQLIFQHYLNFLNQFFPFKKLLFLIFFIRLKNEII